MHHYAKRPRAARPVSWSVPALTKAYRWPSGLKGGGVIGIVELGGGWRGADVQDYFTSVNQPPPAIMDVSVDGTANTPGGDADMEVALDIQVAGASYFMATGKPATIRVYWSQDIPSAVIRAASDGCDVISISWGADEAEWGKEAVYQMDEAAKYAVLKGSIVFAAAGDNDSSDGGPTPANVDCPGSCPWVVCCGGTRLVAGAEEVVWNDNPGSASGEGTGGGYSTIFRQPPWQIGGLLRTPAMRLVPDVAANADPDTGYEIVLNGQVQVVGGTSAVAPLYAGLFAAFGKKLGFVTPRIYRRPSAFTDIVHGNNGVEFAGVGVDACSGVGSPLADELAKVFAAD